MPISILCRHHLSRSQISSYHPTPRPHLSHPPLPSSFPLQLYVVDVNGTVMEHSPCLSQPTLVHDCTDESSLTSADTGEEFELHHARIDNGIPFVIRCGVRYEALESFWGGAEAFSRMQERIRDAATGLSCTRPPEFVDFMVNDWYLVPIVVIILGTLAFPCAVYWLGRECFGLWPPRSNKVADSYAVEGKVRTEEDGGKGPGAGALHRQRTQVRAGSYFGMCCLCVCMLPAPYTLVSSSILFSPCHA